MNGEVTRTSKQEVISDIWNSAPKPKENYKLQVNMNVYPRHNNFFGCAG
jgi:hypothetical protein